MSENLPAIAGLNEMDFIRQAQTNVGFNKDESLIPFCRIMQPLSPQIGSVPGATPGAFLNVATGKVIDGKSGMTVIPVMIKWNFSEWIDRNNNGGGFVKDWGENEESWHHLCDEDQKYAYQPVTKEGHIILRARHFYIFQLDEIGDVEECLLSFQGTALKVAKHWTSMLQYAPKVVTSQGMMTPAHFYYTYNVTTEEVKNAKGRWFLPKITPNIEDGKYVSVWQWPNGKAIWERAVAFRESFQAGKIHARADDVDGGGDTY